MCGIFGCMSDDAAMQVLEGLRKLEYRGYDSAGLAAIFPKNEDEIKKRISLSFDKFLDVSLKSDKDT